MSVNHIIHSFFRIALLFIILPFIALAFFNHAGTDDYIMQSIYSKAGIIEAQKLLYSGWNGRFVANFLQILGVKLQFVSRYYFIHPLLLFFLSWLVALNLVRTLNKFVLKKELSLIQTLEVSFIILTLNIYLLANIGDNFYWFSGALVYQTAIIILFILIAQFIKRLTHPGKNLLQQDILICLLLIMLTGCNETMPVIAMVLLTAGLIFLYRHKSNHRRTVTIYWLVMFITCCIIYLSSGIQTRQKLMNTGTGFVPILSITFFRTLSVFYFTFREPLFWVVAFGCFLQGRKAKSLVIRTSLSKTVIYFLWIPIIIAAILFPLMLVTKGSFPERALNNIIIVTACLILSLCFLTGRCYSSYQTDIALNKRLVSFMPIFFSIALLFSDCQVNAWRSVCSGFFYSRVLKERDKQFGEAQQQGHTSIEINTYLTDVEQQIQKVFPDGIFQSLHIVFLQKPSTIPFFNEAEEQGAASLYAVYYGVDDIEVRSDKR